MGFLAFLTRKSSDRSLSAQPPRNSPPSRQSTSSSFKKSPLSISRSAQELRREYKEPLRFPNHPHLEEEEQDQIQECASQQRRRPWRTDENQDARPNTAPIADDAAQLPQGRLQSRSAGFPPPKRLSTLSTRSYSSGSLIRRCASVRSEQQLGHVDLLDARGEIRPSDFKARLVASGTRDYGEDVADRNIGENGLVLSSDSVQEFYASRQAQGQASLSRLAQVRRAPVETICEKPENVPAATSAPKIDRLPSRSASIRTSSSFRFQTTCRPTSAEGWRPSESRALNRATSTRSRWSVISIGQPKLEHSTAGPSADEDDADSACPPTVLRYRRSEPDSDKQSLSGNGTVPTTLPESSTLQRAQLPIDNINLWGAPLVNLQHEMSASHHAMAQYLGHNLPRRNWSIASTAPTTEGSETSSVLNIRSQSRCTANTSIDLESLIETEEETTEKELTPYAEEKPAITLSTYETDLSCTTDGSDIEAFIKKRSHRAVPDGEALVFNEFGFQDGGGVLPGLFDKPKMCSPEALGKPSIPTPVAEEPQESEDHAEEAESSYSVQTPDSANGIFVPSMYLTQRQRMLALGFDYDTEDEELLGMESDTCDDIQCTEAKMVPQLAIALQQARPSKPEEDRWSDDAKARMALNLRRKVKKHNRSSIKPRRVYETSLEADGNLADTE